MNKVIGPKVPSFNANCIHAPVCDSQREEQVVQRQDPGGVFHGLATHLLSIRKHYSNSQHSSTILSVLGCIRCTWCTYLHKEQIYYLVVITCIIPRHSRC